MRDVSNKIKCMIQSHNYLTITWFSFLHWNCCISLVWHDLVDKEAFVEIWIYSSFCLVDCINMEHYLVMSHLWLWQVPKEWKLDSRWEVESKLPQSLSHTRKFPSKWRSVSPQHDPLNTVRIVDHFVIQRTLEPQLSPQSPQNQWSKAFPLEDASCNLTKKSCTITSHEIV